MEARKIFKALLIFVSTLVVIEVSYTTSQWRVNRIFTGNIPILNVQLVRIHANNTNVHWSNYTQVGHPQDEILPHTSNLDNGYIAALNTKFGCLHTDWNDTIKKVYLPNLEGDSVLFAKLLANRVCFTPGTNIKETLLSDRTNHSQCSCKLGWSGDLCSIPRVAAEAIKRLPKTYLTTIKPRVRARRIIHAFPFNREFDMLETRLAEYGDLVDVFLVLESNYTAYGTPKKRYLHERLNQGKYKDLACKLVYVFLDFFPAEARKDGWIADAIHRNFIGGSRGFKRLANVSPGDIVILTDADEIPSREAIIFLKFHEGYPEPFGFSYKWTIYGYFWENINGRTNDVCGGMTSSMLQNVIHRKMYLMRDPHKISADHSAINAYIKTGRKVFPGGCWMLGNSNHSAGHHCSWCLNAEGIRNKLLSAQNGDFPRWGDYDSKCRILYIEYLVKTGTWFDDITKYRIVNATKPGNAPVHILRSKDKYSHLIWNPYNR